MLNIRSAVVSCPICSAYVRTYVRGGSDIVSHFTHCDVLALHHRPRVYNYTTLIVWFARPWLESIQYTSCAVQLFSYSSDLI